VIHPNDRWWWPIRGLIIYEVAEVAEAIGNFFDTKYAKIVRDGFSLF
jgi:hypothetical protein